MRLQKFMADAGVASRRKCEEFIANGLVYVNGERASIGCVVDPARDSVSFRGKQLVPRAERTILAFNKPAGVVCTASDPEGRKTITSYFSDFPERLYNVGRLDFDSEGLIFMTNDGELANRLMHPKFEIEKVYHVVCDGVLSPDEKQRLERGLMLSDGMTAPARVENLSTMKNGNSSFDIVIHEGRNRQVRRMLEAIGHATLLLRRIRIGNVNLGGLPLGKWRNLTEAELQNLRKSLELS